MATDEVTGDESGGGGAGTGEGLSPLLPEKQPTNKRPSWLELEHMVLETWCNCAQA